MKIESNVEPSGTRLAIAGDCRMSDVAALDAALRALLGSPPASLTVDFGSSGAFDIGPAWLLHRAMRALEGRGTRVVVSGPLPSPFEYLERLPPESGTPPAPAVGPALVRHLAPLGRRIEERAAAGWESLLFGGRLLDTASRAWRRWNGLRLPSVVRHVHDTGVRAIPVVAMIAFLISVIAAYIGAQQLRRSAPRSSRSTSWRSACCASSACCSPRSWSRVAPAAPTRPNSA